MSNPGQIAEPDPYAVTSWGSDGNEGPDTFDFVTSTGQRCLLRKLEITDVLANGILNNLDAVTSVLLSTPNKGATKEDLGLKVLEAFSEGDRFSQFNSVMEKVISICVVKPLLYPKPAEGEELVPGRAYLHKISFGDRVQIFTQVFGGFEGLEQFREEQEGSVEPVENVQDIPLPAEPTGGSAEPINSRVLP